MLYAMSSTILHSALVLPATRAIRLSLAMSLVIFYFICRSKSQRQQSLIYQSILLVKDVQIVNPCQPSPCGLNSICREVDSHAVCSCLPDMLGAPPNCRPECIVASECAQDKSCINRKCKNPCVGACGQYARCQTVNHNPICSCPIGYQGDPFVICVKQEERKRL